MPRITIVLAVYNGEKDVDKCLNSLRGQTMRDIEIICVDDGSIDNTLSVLKRHAAEDTRVKVFEQGENKKLLLAIKRGVKEATGDYIMFIDDDDWYEPNACERVVDIIDTKHPDVVFFGTNLVEIDGREDKALRESRLNRITSYNFEYNGENTLWLKEIKYVYLWNKAVKADVAKAAYDAMPDVEMTYYSDGYASQMIHYYAKTLVSIEDKLINYNYLVGETSQYIMSVDTFDYYLKCSRIFLDGFGSFLKENGTSKDIEKYQEWYKKRILSILRAWRDTVSQGDSLKALESILKYYDAEMVVSALQENYRKVNISRKKYLRKSEKLQKKIDAIEKKRKTLLGRIKMVFK